MSTRSYEWFIPQRTLANMLAIYWIWSKAKNIFPLTRNNGQRTNSISSLVITLQEQSITTYSFNESHYTILKYICATLLFIVISHRIINLTLQLPFPLIFIFAFFLRDVACKLVSFLKCSFSFYKLSVLYYGVDI